MAASDSLPAFGMRLIGSLAPLCAVASMVYFGLFVAGIGVRGIDAGPLLSPLAAVATDLALFASFALVHSLLARQAVKSFLSRNSPQPLERARYSLIAAAQIATLCLLWAPLPTPVWDVPAGIGRALLWVTQGLGWVVVLAALAALGRAGLSEFFGSAQAFAAARAVSFTPGPLVTRGVYRYIRHPLYAGTLVALWSAPTMSQGRLLLALFVTVYLLIGHRFEERDLLRERGDSYRAYRDRVSAWLPYSPKGRPSK